MANLRETAIWEAGIYQWETSDPVMGGENGIDNKPTRQLANRTLWLKNKLAEAIESIGANKSTADSAIALKADKARTISAGAGLTGGGDLSANRTIGLATPSTLSGSTTNWVGNGATGHTHEIAKATPTVAGVVKLLNVLNSTATDAALTAAQGKALAEQITAAVSGSLNWRGALVTQNLNDLHDSSSYGVWHNAANANATTERNYPTLKAGTLFVLPSAYKGQQVYFPFDEKGIYIRDTRSNTNPPSWSAWHKISSDDRVSKAGDTMTGLLSINSSSWARMQFGTNDGNWKMEFDPKGAASRQMNFNFNDTTGERTFIRFPALEKGVNQVVAYQSWVHEQNPQNRSGIDLDTATTPQFFINAQSANPLPVGGDWGGLVLGYANDSTQLIAAGGNMWVRGSDHNPISNPSHWSEWKRLLDETNGVMLSGNQTIAGIKTFANNIHANSEIHAGGLIATSYRNDWVGFLAKQPTEGKHGFFDLSVNNVNRGGLQIVTEGSGRYFTRLMVTPAGATNTDRRIGGLTVYDNSIHSHAYGWLHEGFVRAGVGINQKPNHQIKIGWGNEQRLKATVDTIDLGNIVFDNHFAVNKSVNGYQKLPNGLIIQWMRITKIIGTFSGTYHFPIAFPSTCFGVSISNSWYVSGPGNGYQLRAGVLNNHSFGVGEDNFNNHGIGNSGQAFVIAIGY